MGSTSTLYILLGPEFDGRPIGYQCNHHFPNEDDSSVSGPQGGPGTAWRFQLPMPTPRRQWESLAGFFAEVGARDPGGLAQEWPAEDETRFIYPHLPLLWVLCHQYALEVLYLWHYSTRSQENLINKAIPKLHAELKQALSNLHAQWGHGKKMVRTGVCCQSLMAFHNQLVDFSKSLLALLAEAAEEPNHLMARRKEGIKLLRRRLGWLPAARMQIGDGQSEIEESSTVALASSDSSQTGVVADKAVAAQVGDVGSALPIGQLLELGLVEGQQPEGATTEAEAAEENPDARDAEGRNDDDDSLAAAKAGNKDSVAAVAAATAANTNENDNEVKDSEVKVAAEEENAGTAEEEVKGAAEEGKGAAEEGKAGTAAEGTGDNDDQPEDEMEQLEDDQESGDQSQGEEKQAANANATGPGRPKGSSNSKTFSKAQVRAMCEERFSLIKTAWENSRKVSCKNLLKKFGGTKVSLFCNDAWFEDEEPYTSKYHLNLLRQQAKLATDDAVSVLNGNSAPIQSLIAFYQTAKGKRDLHAAGWGHVDPYSLDVVNIKGGGARGKGMGNRRESLLVCYGKRWNSKITKAKYIANATDPSFWDCFPHKYKPTEAHLNSVLSNTFTGYRSASNLLRNPGTNTRVRPSAEKNPMLYLYLFRRFAFEPDSVVADFFGGTLSSVIAALYTDNRVLVFEKDVDCANLAWDRVITTACKLTARTRVPIGQSREAMAKLSAKKARKDNDDLFEYSYKRMMEVFYSIEYYSTLNLVQ